LPDPASSKSRSVCSRVRELQESLAERIVEVEISNRNVRVAALQRRWDRLNKAFDELLDQRGADMADIPGGATDLLCKDYKGKDADQLVTKIDPGVMALSAELRALERQAAEELAQWKVVIEARKVVDATPAAVMLGMLMSKEQLLDLKRRTLELRQSQVVQVRVKRK
jgi:hypothetical protein